MRRILHNQHWLFALLVATFFLCARAGSIAHAANYGSAPHNHDNQICVFSILPEDDHGDLALPPAEISIPQSAHAFVFFTPSIHRVWLEQTIARTARAPPGQ